MATTQDDLTVLQSMREDPTISRTISAASTPSQNTPLRSLSPPPRRTASTLPTPPTSIAARSTGSSDGNASTSTSTSTDSTSETNVSLRRSISNQLRIWKAWVLSQQTLKVSGAFIAFMTLLIAITGILDITRWSAWQQYVTNCRAKASVGNISKNCQQALTADDEDTPPPRSIGEIVTPTVYRIFGQGNFDIQLDWALTALIIILLVIALLALSLLLGNPLTRLVTFLQDLPSKIKYTAREQDMGTGSPKISASEYHVPQHQQSSEPSNNTDDLFAKTKYSVDKNSNAELQHNTNVTDRASRSVSHPACLTYQDAVTNRELSDVGQAKGATGSLLVSKPERSHSRPRGTLNRTWFLPADGIAREVITADISCYLGNDATIRPGIGTEDYEGVSGYYYTAYRALTSAMVQDLRDDSAVWMRESRAEGPDLSEPSRHMPQHTFYGDAYCKAPEYSNPGTISQPARPLPPPRSFWVPPRQTSNPDNNNSVYPSTASTGYGAGTTYAYSGYPSSSTAYNTEFSSAHGEGLLHRTPGPSYASPYTSTRRFRQYWTGDCKS